LAFASLFVNGGTLKMVSARLGVVAVGCGHTCLNKMRPAFVLARKYGFRRKTLGR